MAGRVLKITLEHTHPPIWRRIIIPDYITFQDLHNIIKILFGWDGYHLHRFENQKYDFYVEAVEDICSDFEYYEEDILVDDFIEDFSWIRYIYDFGDDWKHKIVYEKTDPSYNLRHATLLKYKGDNPVEDCGGVGPWLEFSEFDPISTEEELEKLEIEKREDKGLEGIEYTDLEELDMLPEIDGLFDQVFDAFIKTARANIPGLENASDDEILGGLLEKMMDSVIAEGEIPGLQVADRDKIIHEQLELLKSGKPLTIVQSTKTLQKHLGRMTSRTIFDYLKYCRLTIDDKSAPEAVLANYFSNHVNIFYYFFYKDEMEALLEFWDLYRSGTSVVEGEYLEVIAKCIFLGLIRLTGKRKLKLELCAEFEQILGMVDRNRLDVVYSNIKDTVQTVGTLLMAYAALSFDDFYEMYSKYTKNPMERKEFETFIYWTGTMNRSITTFYYHVTGLEYLALPGMKESLADILVGDTKTLFQVKPRPLSQIEFKRWSEGFDSAIPEWQQFAEMLSFDNPVPDNVFFDIYVNIASGITMTELILEAKVNHEADFDGDFDDDFDDDEYDETEMLEFESDYWHSFAEICLTTPIAGLNGYSREQYAKEFNTTFDYIPLFDYSLLKKRITKYTHIYEFPSEIQLEMLEALRKGGDAYERVIRRLSQKYKSNLALQMECTTIASKKVLEKHPNFEASMNESNIYPWGMDDFDLPMPETYVRESKKIGRNDPCPCGSGKKYKKCCGR